MTDEEFCYTELSNEELQVLWDKHRKLIHNFMDDNGYNKENVFVNESSMLSVIVKVDQRRKYFQYFHKLDMSEVKEVALNAFWIMKLKPLSFTKSGSSKSQESAYQSLNEKLAFYYIIKALRAVAKSVNKKRQVGEMLDSLPKAYIDEVIYAFTYRDISKESLILLVESMAVFMGINPYQSD